MKNKHMAEEKLDNITPTSDDMQVLRVLLHNIKGLSPVSTDASFIPATEDEER